MNNMLLKDIKLMVSRVDPQLQCIYGNILIENNDISLKLIQSGLADFRSNTNQYYKTQLLEAQEKEIGLWKKNKNKATIRRK